MFRSVMAVVAGLVVLTVTSFGIEAVVAELIGAQSSSAGNTAMTAYTLLCIAAGGYVTAWLARRGPVGHAAVMGGIELLFTIGAMVQLGQTARVAAWLPGMLLMVPAAVGGGVLRARQIAQADRARPGIQAE